MELRLMESYKRRGGEEEEGSASSAISAHSHRHLPDLDEDDSACEEELARLAAQVTIIFIFNVPTLDLLPHNKGAYFMYYFIFNIS